MIVLDTSGLLSAIDSSQRLHAAAREVVENTSGPRLLSPFVLAELDYLLLTRVGPDAQLALLDEVSSGRYQLEPFSTGDVARAIETMRRYAGFGDLGLADASNIVLAERYDTLDILTLDERHFRTVTGPGDRPFRLLPMDAGKK